MATATLSYYRLQVRRLLHDANGQFYSDSDLNDYVNQGRLRLCGDTGCMRSLQSLTLVVGQEVYPFSVLGSGVPVIDIWNVTVLYGATRYVLRKSSYSALNAQMRPYVSYTQMPVAWAPYGETAFYLAPKPDQAYATEIDTVVYPGDLTVDATPDTLPVVFQECVQYWGARQAKQSSQDWAEADRFEMLYRKSVINCRASRGLRSIPNPYNIGVN